MSSKNTRKFDNLSNKLQDVNLMKLSLNQKIVLWIDHLGNFSAPDRVYIYFFEKDANDYVIANNTHEWCGKKIRSMKDEQQNIPIDLFPYFKKVLYENKEIARINSINDLTDDVQSMIELMSFQGLKSILAVPIIKETNTIGFIGYETIKKEKIWNNEDLKALKIVACLITVKH
ncbi:MAG: hypothetical protein GPJ51_07270 [Candidatus Heimdallarchaeota archaeon]|nr:hypothetical protein [Candidatus Heimdallarchaeota archaeon]